MSRLIDADALKTVLCASKCGVIDPATCECGCMDVMCIDDAPTIDAVPVWVSVKDRLPNDGQDVLAHLYDCEETRIVPCNYDKGTWYDCLMSCTVAINSITHWMPLPEPPKEVTP